MLKMLCFILPFMCDEPAREYIQFQCLGKSSIKTHISSMRAWTRDEAAAAVEKLCAPGTVTIYRVPAK